jgi:hypothetical protein
MGLDPDWPGFVYSFVSIGRGDSFLILSALDILMAFLTAVGNAGSGHSGGWL